MAVRSGIEIDYCPNCRGVWLDRGELDKIIERHLLEMQGGARSAPRATEPPPAPYRPEPHRSAPPPRYEDDDDYYYDEHHKRKRRKKRDWFEDLFDIFD